MAAGGSIVVARDARACEAELVRRVRRLHDATRRDPSRLAQPVRVVVPSAALREQIALAIVRDVAPAVVGVTVQTIRVLARSVLERAGLAPPRGGSLLEILVRREASRHRALRPLLEDVDGGAALLTGSVRDLLDAGLVDAAGRAAALPTVPAGGAAGARARAIAEVAARIPAALAAAGAARDEDALDEAARLLRAQGEALLPTRALLLIGFADATGTMSRLIGTLLATFGGTALVEHPDDPARPGTPDRGVRFAERFVERLARRAGARVRRRDLEARREGAPPPHATIAAPGPDAELTEVAGRILALLERGVRPEAIGVVARRLDETIVPARRHFAAYGIPWSGGDAPPDLFDGPRRVAALLALLDEGADASLGTLWTARGAPVDHDLRVALVRLGARRLGDVAHVDVAEALDESGRLRLPVRRGLTRHEPEDAEGDPTGARAREHAGATEPGREPGREPEREGQAATIVFPFRKVTRERIEDARARIARVLAARDAWPARAPLGEHLDRFARFVGDDVGARAPAPPPGADEDTPCTWGAWIDGLRAEAPAAFELARDELLAWLRARGEALGVGPAGGRGRGVRVLDVTHARGLAFEHLFVLGVNRHAFPRTVREDPLLPDRVRVAWRRALPDLPVKLDGHDEERYLFAGLLRSAGHVTLSWHTSDDDGRTRVPSPYLERLRLLRDDVPPVTALPRTREGRLRAHPAARPRPPGELLRHAALNGSRADVHAVLPLAFAASWERLSPASRAGAPPVQAYAQARARLLDEVDPPERGRAGRAPSPWSGDVGPVDGLPDPRAQTPSVTAFERLAICPWQAFLGRLLRVEAPLDTHAAWQDVGPRLLGNAVHAVLDQLVRDVVDARDRALVARVRAGPARMPRPSPERVAQAAREVARRVVLHEGLLVEGFVDALAAVAEAYVLRALDEDWPADAVVQTYGAELEGELVLERGGARRALSFRADRVDRRRERVLLVDYKTGRARSERDARRALAQGRGLQAAVYARALGGEHAATGRLLYLGGAAAHVDVLGDDEPAGALLEAALDTLFAIWDRGLFVPRFEEPDRRANDACRTCDVRAACVRDDSTARRRLLEAAIDRPGSVWARVWTLADGAAGDESGRDGRTGDESGRHGRTGGEGDAA